MAVGVKSWSTTASSNGSADSNINFAEGQLAPTVNNSARALMAAVKAFVNGIGGAVTYGGSANAYTITNDTVGAWSAYTAPSIIALKANHTCSGAATVNVDGLGAKSIVTPDGGAMTSGDIVSGGIYILVYDGTNMQVVTTLAGGDFQAKDATLTAIAALAGTSGQIMRWTGTDTFTLDDTSAAGRTIWNFTDPNADQLIFWDDSAASLTGITTLTGMSISGTTLAVSTNLQTWSGVAPGTGVATALAIAVGSAGAFVVNGGALGTPSSGTLTNATGLPISSGVSGLGTGVATALAVNTGSAGAFVVNGGALGTPSSGTLTNCTIPVGGVSGLGTGVATFLATPSSANLAAAVTDEAGTGSLYFTGGALGTPASATLTNATGLPISSGVSGLGTGVATFLATPSSANLASAVTDETGSGALVFATSPTLVTPALGTPSSGTLTNCTSLPVSGITSSTSTALGVGSLELGHASDTTLSRQSAGQMLVEGKAAIQHNGAYTSGQVTFSTSAASGGSSGDIWFKYT